MNEPDLLNVLWLCADASAAVASTQSLPSSAWRLDAVDGLNAYVHAGRRDAIVVSLGAAPSPEELLHWPALSSAAADTALLVLAPRMDATIALRLIQAGAQDVIDIADAGTLPQRLRWAIERKRLELEARKAATADLMTGLPNRTQFIEHMSQLIALRERENAAVNLLVLRIDGLAGVEAGHGLESANVVRRKAAVRVRAALRASDVVASMGADVFAVLLPSTATLPDVQRVVTKLMRWLREPFNVAGSAVPLTAHAGIAQFPVDGRQPDELLRHASAAALSKAYPGGAAND